MKVCDVTATFDTEPAADTKRLVDLVHIEGVLHIAAGDGGGGTELMFGGRIGGFCGALMIATTEIAIPTERMGVDAFNGRGREHAGGGAESALGTLIGVHLPNMSPYPAARGCPNGDASDGCGGRTAETAAYKASPRRFWLLRLAHLASGVAPLADNAAGSPHASTRPQLQQMLLLMQV